MTTKILAFLEENEPKKQAIDEALSFINEEIENKTQELNKLTEAQTNNAGNLSENIKKIATLRAELNEYKAMKKEKQDELKELITSNYYGGLEEYVVNDMNKPFDDIRRDSNRQMVEKLREFEKEIKRIEVQTNEQMTAKQEELKELRRRVAKFIPSDDRHYHSKLMSMLTTLYDSKLTEILNVTEWIK